MGASRGREPRSGVGEAHHAARSGPVDSQGELLFTLTPPTTPNDFPSYSTTSTTATRVRWLCELTSKPHTRQRLSSAEADRSLTDKQRKEAIAAATRYLDASATLALIAVDDDLNDGSDGPCKSATCNELKSLVEDIEDGGPEGDRLASFSSEQLYNHVAGKLLINATRSLVSVLGMSSTTCTVLSRMEQRVAYLDRVYVEEAGEKLRANLLAKLLARLEGAGREVPAVARRSLEDLASWLTNDAAR